MSPIFSHTTYFDVKLNNKSIEPTPKAKFNRQLRFSVAALVCSELQKEFTKWYFYTNKTSSLLNLIKQFIRWNHKSCLKAQIGCPMPQFKVHLPLEKIMGYFKGQRYSQRYSFLLLGGFCYIGQKQ